MPILFFSAKTGQRVNQVLPEALKVQEERLGVWHRADHAFCKTRRINILPVTSGGLCIFILTRCAAIPTYILNDSNGPFNISRYLENQIRKATRYGTPSVGIERRALGIGLENNKNSRALVPGNKTFYINLVSQGFECNGNSEGCRDCGIFKYSTRGRQSRGRE